MGPKTNPQGFPGLQELQKDFYAPRSGRGEIRKAEVKLKGAMILRMNDISNIWGLMAEFQISQRVSVKILIWTDVF